MSGLGGSAINRRSIDVYGITGEFCVLENSAGSPVKVKYFQTVASNRSDDASGNALDLLSELKPMRERVSSEDLKDLRSLLQRDLSDLRVANDLVPYLQGKGAQVGFFPSILVALIPKGFLKEDDGAVYPLPVVNPENELKKQYGDFWGVENYKMDGKKVSLARLSVNPAGTDFIVLDGQHRANAFRYMAGTFEAATDEASIYSVFYQNCDDPDAENFNAELPVTVVWFEGEDAVTPSLISRRLFVDVNTTAKMVSESRNILLNDTDLASICVTSIYSKLAEQGYYLNQLSLLHSGFDCEGKFPSDYPRMSIFSPRTLHYMLSYFLFSTPNHMSLSNIISKDSYGNFGSYTGRIKDLCIGLDDRIISGVNSGDSNSLNQAIELLNGCLVPKVYRILNDFSFLGPHYSACVELDSDLRASGAVENISAWNKVFKGGEGLYNAFNDDALNSVDQTGRLSTYKIAVDKINSDFSSCRKSSNEGYEAAFNTFTSQAGITGFFLALEKCFELEGWDDNLIARFLDVINSYSVDQWVIILTKYKSVVVPENSPKLWPLLRGIFLRFIEFKSDRWDFFNQSALESYHPDYMFCKNLVKTEYKEYKRVNSEDKPDGDIIEGWICSSVESLASTLLSIDVESYCQEKITLKLKYWLTGELSKDYSDEEV